MSASFLEPQKLRLLHAIAEKDRPIAYFNGRQLRSVMEMTGAGLVSLQGDILQITPKGTAALRINSPRMPSKILWLIGASAAYLLANICIQCWMEDTHERHADHHENGWIEHAHAAR